MSPEQLRQGLQKHFGFEDFMEGQLPAVSAVATGKDVLVVMPTGAGKSLCYQLPALLRPGYTIVISPLIALMKDQVDALNARGIPAARIDSTQDVYTQREVIQGALNGRIRLLYASPERLRARGFREMIAANPPSLLVIDEAHCISQWGHDFRPDYSRVGEFAAACRVPQVAAFTATATPLVRDDIRAQLRRTDMLTLVSGFTRPNLAFSVLEAESVKRKDEILRELLAEKKPTIIYCSTRKQVESLAENLGIKGYHAGMGDAARTESQEWFLKDPCPVLAATNAFGMGIDRSDVRRVIHYSLPASPEAYYQEAGRAGRDGESADCILLWCFMDRKIQEFLIEIGAPDEASVRALWKVLRQRRMSSGPLVEEPQEALAKAAGLKGEQQVSGALKLLERAGFVERSARGGGRGVLRARAPLPQWQERAGGPRTQRSIFIGQALREWGSSLPDGVAASWEDLADISGLTREQLPRVLDALRSDNLLDWTPPFSGRGIAVLREDAEPSGIDYGAVEKKKQLDVERLGAMISFSRARGCRQAQLISYFGQEVKGWRCHACDRCREAEGSLTARETGPQEIAILQLLLSGVEHHHERIGLAKLALVLAGKRTQQTLESRLTDSPHFGKLKFLDEETIIATFESLEGIGFVGRSRGRYALVEITSRGREFNRRPKPLRLALPEFAIPAKKTEASSRSSAPVEKRAAAVKVAPVYDRDLFEALREVRNRLAAEEEVPPFIIAPNSALEAVAAAHPRDAESLAQVSSFGQPRTEKYGAAFLVVLRG